VKNLPRWFPAIVLICVVAFVVSIFARGIGAGDLGGGSSGAMPLEGLARIPVSAGGRTKPLDTYARNLLASGTAVPGDGNLDGVVDSADISGIFHWWGGQSVYDFNTDGITNGDDLAQVLNGWTGRP
jgi:hypothetical protein